jgi:hypothetical protein
MIRFADISYQFKLKVWRIERSVGALPPALYSIDMKIDMKTAITAGSRWDHGLAN